MSDENKILDAEIDELGELEFEIIDTSVSTALPETGASCCSCCESCCCSLLV